MKRVIITMPVYNGEKYLPALLDSIAAQTYPALKLYVRDDGSTDASVRILRDYQCNFPEGKELVLVNDLDKDMGNKGPHENFHHIFHILQDCRYRDDATADYYFFCDQDDVWAPEKIERAVSRMDRYPANTPVLYIHNYYVCDGDLNIQHTLPDRPCVTPQEMERINLAKVIMTGTWAGMGMAQGFNLTLKKLAFDSGPLTPSVAVDCWISWVVAGMNGALIYDKDPLAHYRRHKDTFSSGNAGGLKRYRDWHKNMDRHCANIINGIHDYRRLYGQKVSPQRRHFLELYDSKKGIRKCLYPHRLRDSLVAEIALRVLAAAGKI